MLHLGLQKLVVRLGLSRSFRLQEILIGSHSPPLWTPFRPLNWYQSLVKVFNNLTGSKTTWRPWRVLVKSQCLPARTMLIGRFACVPSCKAWEPRSGIPPRTRRTRCLPFGPVLFRCPSTRRTPRLLMHCSLAFLVRSSHASRVFRKPTKFGRALRTTPRAQLRLRLGFSRLTSVNMRTSHRCRVRALVTCSVGFNRL